MPAALKIVRNIRLSDGARDWLLRHYMDPDLDDPSQLRFIPKLRHALATYDSKWNKVAGQHYSLVKGEPRQLRTEVVSPFENGRKFFAIGFAEEFDESARYLIEYFDGVWRQPEPPPALG